MYLLPIQDATEDQMEQECANILKRELNLNRSEFSGKLVKKKYAFEIKDIPNEETTYYEVKYSSKCKNTMPIKISNSKIFSAALQTT
jgi:hypothetical protein